MKKIIVLFVITASIAACGNGNSANTGHAGDSTPTITSGNTDARQGQVIPTDSVERSSDSTGNIHPGDTTKK
jgi:hypothetical protein